MEFQLKNYHIKYSHVIKKLLFKSFGLKKKFNAFKIKMLINYM